MIQGHAIDALLASAFRAGPLFRAWTFTRGLTSTAFLFAAGFAFALVTFDPQRARVGRGHRLRRGAQLVILGYLLRAPLGVLFGEPWPVALERAQIVDVLQCIGVSLWLLELLTFLGSTRSAKVTLSLALASACFLATELSAQLVPQGPFAPLLHYLTSRGGSLFPLVPWSGHLFWGYALGVTVLVRTAEQPERLPRYLSFSAALLLSLALVAWLGGAGSQAFLLLKLGLVVLVSAALASVIGAQGRLPRWLERLSGETLFLYVSHVLILYGTGLGLSSLVGRSLTPLGAGLSALAFVLVCSASALAYSRALEALRVRKGRSRPARKRIGSRGETENHSS